MTTPSRHATAALLAAFSFITSVVLVLVALEISTGATLQPGSTTSYDTEYIDWRVYAVTALLPFVLGVAAAYSAWFAVLGTVGVFGVELWGVWESNERLAAAGWSDGLEVLAFLLPVGALVGTLVLVLIGGVAGSSQRKVEERQDQYTMTLSPLSTWSNNQATPS